MKVIISALLFFFPIFEATYLDNRITIVSPGISKCMCATGVDPSLVQQWLSRIQYPNHPCFKCFLRCISIETGGSTIGVYDPNFIIKTFGVQPAVVQSCIEKTTNITDLCQKSYVLVPCLVLSLMN